MPPTSRTQIQCCRLRGSFKGPQQRLEGRFMMKPITLDRAMTLTSLKECRKQDGNKIIVCSLTSSLSCFYKQQPSPQLRNFSVPALVPPNRLIAFGLKRCHDHVHIIVSVSQHALLVGRHHGVGRQPANTTGDCSSRRLLNLYSTTGRG